MSIRFFSNTKYKNLEAKFLFEGIKHYLHLVDRSKIESIELNDKSLTVFGVECILLETDLKPIKVKGKIRWFNESSGEGVIRLPNGDSLPFYSCNCVGANSPYPELTDNIHFREGEEVEATLSDDPYMVECLGLIDVKAVSRE